MKRIITLLLSMVFIFSVFTSCGQNNNSDTNSSSNSTAKSPAVSDITKNVTAKSEFPEMKELSEKSLKNIYGIDMSYVESHSVLVDSSGATASEIAVIKVKHVADVKKVEEVFNARCTSQIESFTNYVDAEVPKIKNATIKSKGNYVYLIISNDNKKAESAINELL